VLIVDLKDLSEQEEESTRLEVGDVVKLQHGDSAPADLIFLQSKSG
jgi:magnesium-transporting ATPase (P-type)